MLSMVKSIIIFILTRFKMLLDRFIINTDYDSQKIQKTLDLSIIVAEFNLAGNAQREFNTTVTIDQGQYFENIFISNQEIVGNYTLVGSSPVYNKSGAYRVLFDAYRSDATHYKLTVSFINLTGDTIVIPTNTTKARVHLLVASKQ